MADTISNHSHAIRCAISDIGQRNRQIRLSAVTPKNIREPAIGVGYANPFDHPSGFWAIPAT
ncbi:hypothetical protein [Gordonia bronchialis]|uniref:hypothetical protein n=1 Tax=Gordonia bronchialis TaxID=2054 RepID=UPI002271349D|nr:hypothetical protein [Gordonia bronchialis]